MAYLTSEQIRNRRQQDTTDTSNDARYAELSDACSTGIDDYCGRTFLSDLNAATPVTSVRYFRPSLDGSLVFLDDVASLEGLVVSTGSGDSYSELVRGTDYHVDQPTRPGKPYEFLRMLGSTFLYSWYGEATVKVEAYWGWPDAVPTPILEACNTFVDQVFRDPQAPSGVMGFGDMGAIRLPVMHPRVKAFLSPYMKLDRGMFA